MSKPQYRMTDHAVARYQERRRRHSLYIAADLYRARPVTKGQMRKLGRRPKAGQRLLVTPDRFAFVAIGAVIVTCFEIRAKV